MKEASVSIASTGSQNAVDSGKQGKRMGNSLILSGCKNCCNYQTNTHKKYKKGIIRRSTLTVAGQHHIGLIQLNRKTSSMEFQTVYL